MLEGVHGRYVFTEIIWEVDWKIGQHLAKMGSKGAFLPVEQNLSLLPLEVGKHAIVGSSFLLPKPAICVSPIPKGSGSQYEFEYLTRSPLLDWAD
jgi:hypothetical protein